MNMQSELKTLNLYNYQRIIDSKLSEIEISNPNINEIIKYVLNAKGKRLRPILTLIVSKAFGADISDAIKPAIGIELIHNFTLVHDDIMDGDKMRHGIETVHSRWDDGTAILAGDALLALGYRYILGSLQQSNIIEDVSSTLLKVCEGQLVDKRFESSKDINLDQYISMIDLKTGCLLGLAAELGAVSIGLELHRKKFYQFGKLIGRAFQIQDDYLEIFSDSDRMGKSLSSDILLGKKTYFITMASEIDENEINRCLDIAHSDIYLATASIREFLISNGLDSKGKELISDTIDLAYSMIEDLDVNLSEITGFINYIIDRKS